MAAPKTDAPVLEPLVLPPLVLPPTPPAIKDGWKTSEGRLAIVTMVAALAGQISGALPEPWPAVIMAVCTCVFTLARTLLKIRALPSVR